MSTIIDLYSSLMGLAWVGISALFTIWLIKILILGIIK